MISMKGSHNSATGERPANWWARLFPMVAKCQSKTLEEQCEAGVTLFDIRVRWHDEHLFVHHGLARYDLTLEEVFNLLDRKAPSLSVVMVTYEGECPEERDEEFIRLVEDQFAHCYNIRLGDISVKCPLWRIVKVSDYQPQYEQNYVKIVGWRRLLPFPWLWWLMRKLNVANENKGQTISMEDFV